VIRKILCTLEDLTGARKRSRQPMHMPWAADVDVQIELNDADGEPVNLSGWAIFFAIRVKPSDELPVIARELDVLEVSEGTAECSITQDDREDLVVGSYWYDVRGELDGVSHQLCEAAPWIVDPSVSRPDDDITAPVAGEPLAYPPGFYRGYAELTDPGFADVCEAEMDASRAGVFEVKVACIDIATSKSASWIVLGHYVVDDAGVLSFPVSHQLDLEYVHADLMAETVAMDVVASGSSIIVQGDPGTYGTLRWGAQIHLIDAGVEP
jgi:hypothetical protein